MSELGFLRFEDDRIASLCGTQN